MIHSYVVGRKQRVTIDNEYSTWQEICFGVPQGLIITPSIGSKKLYSNIHICDVFFAVESKDITSYADDTTPQACCEEIYLIIEKLEVKANEIHQWFNENAMEANAGKCHLLLTTNEENTSFYWGRNNTKQ